MTRPSHPLVLLLAAACLAFVFAAASQATTDPIPAEQTTEISRDSLYRPLAWLIGTWEGTFEVPGGVKPRMSFTWSSNPSYIRVQGLKPDGDRLAVEYEGTIVWHPVEQLFVFLAIYDSRRAYLMEDGDITLLADGSPRLNMRVHYAEGVTLPWSDGAKAGPGGHTLEFRRTFHRVGDDGLRGVFLMKKGGRWESPKFHHPVPEGGFPWRRIAD